jgi:aminomuconate-semialdehyde/2-hydroxymuconate-6-semialdehyde dehydrogenase
MVQAKRLDVTVPEGDIDVARHILNYIDGRFEEGGAGATFANIDPASGRETGRVHEATLADVDRAVRAARRALTGPWGQMTTAERVRLIAAVADEIERRKEDFLAAEVADTGKPRHVASHIDIPRGASNFRMFADVVSTLPTEAFATPTPDGAGALNYTVRKRCHLPMEFPALADDLEGGTRTRLRQHGRRKALRRNSAHRGAAGRSDGRRGYARGRI